MQRKSSSQMHDTTKEKQSRSSVSFAPTDLSSHIVPATAMVNSRRPMQHQPNYYDNQRGDRYNDHLSMDFDRAGVVKRSKQRSNTSRDMYDSEIPDAVITSRNPINSHNGVSFAPTNVRETIKPVTAFNRQNNRNRRNPIPQQNNYQRSHPTSTRLYMSTRNQDFQVSLKLTPLHQQYLSVHQWETPMDLDIVVHTTIHKGHRDSTTTSKTDTTHHIHPHLPNIKHLGSQNLKTVIIVLPINTTTGIMVTMDIHPLLPYHHPRGRIQLDRQYL